MAASWHHQLEPKGILAIMPAIPTHDDTHSSYHQNEIKTQRPGDMKIILSLLERTNDVVNVKALGTVPSTISAV